MVIRKIVAHARRTAAALVTVGAATLACGISPASAISVTVTSTTLNASVTASNCWFPVAAPGPTETQPGTQPLGPTQCATQSDSYNGAWPSDPRALSVATTFATASLTTPYGSGLTSMAGAFISFPTQGPTFGPPFAQCDGVYCRPSSREAIASLAYSVTFSVDGNASVYANPFLGPRTTTGTYKLFDATSSALLTDDLTPPYALSTGTYRLEFLGTLAATLDSNQIGGNGSFLADSFTISSPSIVPVPAPSSWALMLAGIGIAGAARMRRAAAK